jgi:3-hexulose-6-phosphate synthase/6-phospho-3-hexuloisomerase
MWTAMPLNIDLDGPRLQLALDIVDLGRALQIAREAVAGGVDWLEVGTPLIKSEGMEAVRQLKKDHMDLPVVADMKTMDVGGFETEIAAKAGADVVCIMGASDDGTIKESVRAAEKYGSRVMVDLMGVADKPARAREVAEMGVDYLCLHVGVDAQMEGGNPLGEVQAISEATDLPIATAGGITSETANDALDAGASIVIVGGAIYKAEDVTEAARAIKEAITDRKFVESKLFKKYDRAGIKKVMYMVSTPNISDAMHKHGAMRDIRPIVNRGRKMAGPAFVVQTLDGDWAKPVEAISKASPGDVIVIEAGGGRRAVWGELASWSCKVKGIEGVVIDGGIRDVPDILDMDFPAFAKRQVSAAGEPKGHGEMGAPVRCGGQVVRCGDWVVGDETGVVVVPKDRVVEIANRALDVMERENRFREEIKRGSDLSKVAYLEKWEKIG